MRRLAILLVLGLVVAPAAQASGLAYRTEGQAQRFLENTLRSWNGVNLETKKYRHRVAFCLPGSRSKYEQTHRHFAVHATKTGEVRYHTFTCTLAAANKVFHLYVVARPKGFGLRNDL